MEAERQLGSGGGSGEGEASGRADRPGRPWSSTNEDSRAGGLEGTGEQGTWEQGGERARTRGPEGTRVAKRRLGSGGGPGTGEGEAGGRADRPGRPWSATSEDSRAGGLEGAIVDRMISWPVGKGDKAGRWRTSGYAGPYLAAGEAVVAEVDGKATAGYRVG